MATMTELTDEPAAPEADTTEDAELQALESQILAAEAGRGEGGRAREDAADTDTADGSTASESAHPSDPSTSDPAKGTEVKDKAAPRAGDQQTDKQQQATKAEAPAKDAEQQKPESAYKRAERLAKAEKRLAEDRKRFDADREEFRRQQQSRVASGPAASEQREPTADDFEAAAKELADDGQHDKAYEALSHARELRTKELHAGFHESWTAQMQEAGNEIPELRAKDSPVAARALELIRKEPVYASVFNGAKLAAYRAHAEVASARASALEAKLGDAQQRIAALEGKLAPLRGNPQGAPPAGKSFDAMSEDEMEEYLLAQARAADRRG